MQAASSLLRKKDLMLRVFIALILAAGIVLRLAMFFQNRNLIIDEANIVRNLAERGFGGLVLPLKYEQYAPPVFLWIEKLASLLFGYGEKAMRLYPLLCGLATLFVFPAVAKKMMRLEALWLPLAYLAGGFIFIKYSAELKQYMPDTLIALMLVWLALRWDFRKLSHARFAVYWMLAGTVAIWSSMPSVFILAGVGCYYAWPLLREKKYRALLPLFLIAGVWLLQFGLYYFSILKPEIESSYLQNYHREYFLFATPASKEEWLHNWERLQDILGNVGGWSAVAIVSNLVFIVIGGVHLLWKRTRLFLLAGLPICLVLIAAALNQFSLIDRVVLFMLPLWLLLLGAGFDALLRMRVPVWPLLILVGVFDAWAYADVQLLKHPYQFHEITKGMDWIQACGGCGPALYVHDANVPTYIYYTELHPKKARYASLLGAHRLKWDDDYAQITRGIKDTAYFLYTGGFPEGERTKRTKEIEQNMRQVGYFEDAICFVFIYVPKRSMDSSGTTPN
jgi:hypothetical protein